jgi:ligand-binding sensor domain-containing protein/serine phosphatase RsbU (regulator of sigma subunit)
MQTAKLTRLLVAILLLISVSAAKLRAQELKFAHLSTEEGVSQAVINCITQDSKGFMWFGTQDGLNRYDGYHVTEYRHNPDDSSTISSNFIWSIYEDKQGMMWIGTNGGGLNSYDPRTGKFTRYFSKAKDNSSLSNNVVREIIEDHEGTIWVGTDEGLNALDRNTGKFTRYQSSSKVPGSISNNNVWALAEDQQHRLWVGTRGGGVNLLDKKTGKFKIFEAATELFRNGNHDEAKVHSNSHMIRDLYVDKEGYLWVATDGGGLGIFDTQTEKYLDFLITADQYNSLSNNRISAIAEDANGVMWVATLLGGLNEYHKKTGRFIHYKNDEKVPYSLNNNELRCLFIDNQDNVWIGTQGGGVNIYFRANNKFQYYKKNERIKDDLTSDFVMSLMVDKDDLLWIGTNGGGLTTFDRKSTAFSYASDINSKLKNLAILSIFQDREGLIWAGTWGGGAASYNKETRAVKLYPEQDAGLSNGTVLAMAQDKKGLIWFATYRGGIYALDKSTDKFTNYSTKDGLPSDNIYCLFIDNEGTLWIGTEGGGLCRRDPSTGKFQVYQRSNSPGNISSNTVYCINQDKKGDLWIGTTSGLNRMDIKTGGFTSYYEKDGLPNDNVYAVMFDKDDYIWMTTNKGVSRFNPRAENVDGSAFRNYDSKDGLQGLEFNQGAYCKARSGEMFIGGLNGFNAFSPEKIKGNTHVPPVYLTSYKRFGKDVAMDTLITDKKYIELSYKDNFFSFEFVALDYVMPGQNKYSYKMEGVDEDWTPATTTRYASYTQLQGGDYVFRVRASNNDGVWNNEGAVLHIRIIPPFWKTNWFYALCVLTVIAAVFGFIKYRTASIKRENKILEAKVEERTRELAEKNRDITSSIQYAQRIQEAILPPLRQIFSHFPDAFILYRPKDIVSGDFYWFGEKNGKKIIAAVDCTGHGVPGAFMSMIGHNLLNQIIIEKGITEPASILNELHHGVQSALKQGSNTVVDTSDGMDVSLCTIDMQKRELQFAGAYRPLFVFNFNDFEKIDGNKFPIGGSQLDHERTFTNHTRFLKKGDTIYMFSDGYADQFGGDNGKKFMVKRFNQLLLSIQDLPMEEQGRILDQAIESWRGSYQQVDDILVMGIRF